MKTIKLSDKPTQPCDLREGEIIRVIIKDVPYLMRVCEYTTTNGCFGCSVHKHKISAGGEVNLICQDIDLGFVCGPYIFVDVADILEDL